MKNKTARTRNLSDFESYIISNTDQVKGGQEIIIIDSNVG